MAKTLYLNNCHLLNKFICFQFLDLEKYNHTSNKDIKKEEKFKSKEERKEEINAVINAVIVNCQETL